MGVSTYCIIWTLWLCKTKQVPRGLIYWLPTKSNVSDFVSTKVDDFIDENAMTLGGLKSDKFNVGLKYFYGVPTYWRGLESKSGVKSISADAAVYDEFDEADQAQVTQARQRLSASTVKISRELSVPTIPDFGINKRFQETDQCHYAFKCSACSTWNILEENWPNAFLQKLDGSYYRACKKCQKELDVTEGEWVQKQNKQMRGYQISQLYSPFVTPTEIMADYFNTQFPGHFSNHVLGLPYLAAEDRVDFEMAINSCDPTRSMLNSNIKPCAMGVDVGSVLHVTILEAGQPYKVVHMKEYKTFEELDAIILKFNVKEAVFDALPETRKVREFIARHQYRAWACFYNDNQKGNYAWKEDERIVQVNRTESMDVGTLAFVNKKISLPQRTPAVEEFCKHVANVAKVAEEDSETGSKRYIYKKLGPDHYRHSLNYAMIASSRLRSGSITSVFR